ncbi:hypothetical protein HN937_12300 [Candidatus Poribacteria bacterium]|nr:hypothetical protein [Candidatus Poribacteria bacterium]
MAQRLIDRCKAEQPPWFEGFGWAWDELHEWAARAHLRFSEDGKPGRFWTIIVDESLGAWEGFTVEACGHTVRSPDLASSLAFVACLVFDEQKREHPALFTKHRWRQPWDSLFRNDLIGPNPEGGSVIVFPPGLEQAAKALIDQGGS